MSDYFEDGIDGPASRAAAVTPSDTATIETTRGLWIGVDGNIAVLFEKDTQAVTLKNATGMLPLRVKKVLSTGTTATDIIALY